MCKNRSLKISLINQTAVNTILGHQKTENKLQTQITELNVNLDLTRQSIREGTEG